MKRLKASRSHHEAEIAELAANRELAREYLKAALESLDDPDDRGAGLLALRTMAEAYGGLAAVAAEAGISRESLYRALSPKGNPTLKTLLAVLKEDGGLAAFGQIPRAYARLRICRQDRPGDRFVIAR